MLILLVLGGVIWAAVSFADGDHPVQGTLWFTYNGERLSDLRDRLEGKNE